MIILNIDIGVIHFAFTQFEIKNVDDDEEEKEEIKLLATELIDITQYTHHSIPKSECKLHHTRTMCDWIEHTIQEYFSVFSTSDVILVERQPPTSPFIAIEQLIFSKYRDKVQLIAPQNVHSFFSISYLTYDDRKKYSEKIARCFLKSILEEEEIKKYEKKVEMYDRYHDISDSICIFLYWKQKRDKQLLQEKRRKQMELLKDLNGLSVIEKLERFRYIAKK